MTLRLKFYRKTLATRDYRAPSRGRVAEDQIVEIRKDPLTGLSCRINVTRHSRFLKIKEDARDLTALAKETRSECPFCPDRLLESTPTFSEAIAEEGRFRKGEFVLFPNLFPFGVYHAVGVLTSEHFVSLDRISVGQIRDCLETCNSFFQQVNRKASSYLYPSVNVNFLPPAAASQVHPHVQALIEQEPPYGLSLMLSKSQEYFDRFHRNYWSDLVNIEKKGVRYVGRTGSFDWIASFAPRANCETVGVSRESVSTLTSMKEHDLHSLSVGIHKVFVAFTRMGVQSVNLAVFSGPVRPDISRFFSLNTRILSRPKLSRYYPSDQGFMDILFDEPVISMSPEMVADRLRALMFHHMDSHGGTGPLDSTRSHARVAQRKSVRNAYSQGL